MLGGAAVLLGKYADTAVSFSPGGEQVAYTLGIGGRNILEVRIANADGTGDRLLASIPDGADDFQQEPAWSPDGKAIAVPVMLLGEKVRWAVEIVSVANGSVQELHSYSHEVGRAVWLPDGDGLLITLRDQAGRGQLWEIFYPQGKAVRVTNDLEDYALDLDVTRDGEKLALIATTLDSNIWTIPDAHIPKDRQITAGAEPLTQIVPMPQGKLLARSENGQMWQMRPDGSDRTPFTTARNVDSPALCGDAVVFNSLHDDTIDLIRVDADGLNPTKLFGGDIGPPSCSKDGQFIFFARKFKPHTILRLPSGGGDPVVIAKSPGFEIRGRVANSPDGQFLAYVFDESAFEGSTKVGVIPIGGGEPVRTYKVAIDALDLRWSADGRSLQYLLLRNGATNIWDQPITGGEPNQLTQFVSGIIFDFDWSADGKQLLLARGNASSDVVLLTNLR